MSKCITPLQVGLENVEKSCGQGYKRFALKTKWCCGS